MGESLKEQGNHATAGTGHRRILRALVTVQVAVALALLTGATCAVVDLVKSERRKLGFDPRSLLSAALTREQEDNQENRRFYQDLSKRLRAVPGVTSVGLASVEPLARQSEAVQLEIPGRPAARPGEELEGKLTIADGDYFKTAAIEVLEGTVFTAKDDESVPAVAVLSRQAAETFFPGQKAVGKTIVQIDRAKRTSCTVIGIVDEVAAQWKKDVGMVYRPFLQEPRGEMTAIVRGSDPVLLEQPVRDAVHALDRSQPVQTKLCNVFVDEFLWPRRTLVRFIAIPAMLAMLLAVLGVYGVAAYSVNQRRPELGIRAALGATPRALVRTVMREALWIAAIGGTVGLALSVGVMLVLGRADMAPFSPIWTLGLTFALCFVVLLASFGPARRAARASPSLAIRSS